MYRLSGFFCLAPNPYALSGATCTLCAASTECLLVGDAGSVVRRTVCDFRALLCGADFVCGLAQFGCASDDGRIRFECIYCFDPSYRFGH